MENRGVMTQTTRDRDIETGLDRVGAHEEKRPRERKGLGLDQRKKRTRVRPERERTRTRPEGGKNWHSTREGKAQAETCRDKAPGVPQNQTGARRHPEVRREGGPDAQKNRNKEAKSGRNKEAQRPTVPR